ncbi:MAG: type I methionyl aminopeptidase [Chloroflexi bacterium]|nr:type I methionyl aminopeptidase [Chloroflexota bacterium]
MGIILKSPAEIELMREAGRINALALWEMAKAVRPGVTTHELDCIAAEVLRKHGATPAFLNYPNREFPEKPYPAVINASINAELVHGIPGKRRLREGDIISLDCGTIYRGFVGDSAITLPVGRISAQARQLLGVTSEALRIGVAACRAGTHMGDVSFAIQSFVEGKGYRVAREYTGHGVGREMHEEPDVPNWGHPDRGPLLKPGMTFALEPMVMVGSEELYIKNNHWTVATVDGQLCAHFEHTIAVTENGPFILTRWEDEWKI